jgi:hypothetical protein
MTSKREIISKHLNKVGVVLMMLIIPFIQDKQHPNYTKKDHPSTLKFLNGRLLQLSASSPTGQSRLTSYDNERFFSVEYYAIAVKYNNERFLSVEHPTIVVKYNNERFFSVEHRTNAVKCNNERRNIRLLSMTTPLTARRTDAAG